MRRSFVAVVLFLLFFGFCYSNIFIYRFLLGIQTQEQMAKSGHVGISKNTFESIHNDSENDEALRISIIEPRNETVLLDSARVTINTSGGEPPVSVSIAIKNDSWIRVIDSIKLWDSSYEYQFAIDGLENGAYSIVVNATDANYRTASSHVNVYVLDSVPPIIVVDDDVGDCFETYYIEALEGMGYSCGKDFLYWNNSQQGPPPREILDNVVVAIWFTGNDFASTLFERERSVLQGFLRKAGQLFISGQDIGYDIGNTSWYNCWLKAIFENDNTGSAVVNGVGGTFFEGESYRLYGSYGANNNNYPSEIAPYNGSYLLMYYDSDMETGAAIAYDGEYRLVYFAFPFESINGSSRRIDAMAKILEWMDRPVANIYHYTSFFEGENEFLNLSLAARSRNNISRVEVYINNSLVFNKTVNSRVYLENITINVTSFGFGSLNVTLRAVDIMGEDCSSTMFVVPSLKVRIKSPHSGDIIWSSVRIMIDVVAVRINNWSMSLTIYNDSWSCVAVPTYNSSSHTFYFDWNTTNISDGLYNITVVANSPFISSSDTVANICVWNSYIPLLVIDYDEDFGAWGYYDEALRDIGLTEYIDYLYWNACSKGFPPEEIVMRSIRIVLFYGWGYPFSGERDIIGKYLWAAGQMFIAGQDIAYHVYYADSEWLEIYLKTRFISDDINATSIEGENQTIFEGEKYSLTGSDSACNGISLDVIEACCGSNCLFSYDPENECAAIIYDDMYRLIFFAFPFESVNGSVERAYIIDKILNWTSSIIVSANITDYTAIGDIVPIKISARGLHVIEEINVYINDTLVFSRGTNNEIVSLETVLNTTGYPSDCVLNLTIVAIDCFNEVDKYDVFLVRDITPPEIAIIQPANDTVFNISVPILWSAADNIGISHFEVYLDKHIFAVLDADVTSILLNITEAGSHEVCIKAYDFAGNFDSAYVVFFVDTEKPSVILLEPACVYSGVSFVNTYTVTIKWCVYDDLWVDHSEILIDYGSWINVGSNDSYTVRLGDGTHVVRIRAYDAVQNIGEIKVEIVVDRLKPYLKILAPENETYFNYSPVITIEWQAYDNSGETRQYVIIDNSTNITVAGNNYTIRNLSEGSHIIEVVVRDLAGNTARKCIVLYIDLTPPTISVISPGNKSYILGKKLHVILSVSDNIAIMNISILVDGVQRYDVDIVSQEIYIELTDGEHILDIEAYDKAGHVTIVSICVKVIHKKVQMLLVALSVTCAVAIIIVKLKKERQRKNKKSS